MAEAVAPVPQKQIFVDEPVSEVGQLSQWTLMRLRFARNKLAMLGLFGMIFIYILVFLGGFIAPNEYTFQNTEYIFGSPSPVTFIGPEGKFGLRPYTYEVTSILNTETYRWDVTFDKTKKVPIKFFVKGDQVKVLWFKTTNAPV